MGYFDDIKNEEELFAEYKKLQRIHHPDWFIKDGEDVVEAQTEIFKDITEEFEAKKAEFLNQKSNEFKEMYKTTPADYFNKLRKNPEVAEAGANLVNVATKKVAEMFAEKLNNKIWR